MIEIGSTKNETAVLVGIIDSEQNAEKATEHLDELEFLATTLGIVTKQKYTQRMNKRDPKFFIGGGKVEEITKFVKENKTDCVIFDDDLSPSQLRNLEETMGVQIFDRSLLILEIFLKRAKSSQSKTQVELARYQYLLPRLTRMWTHLERQRGGTGTRGGSGEKEIETDKRVIRNQISVLKKKLSKIDQQNEVQRKSRARMVRVALVGYTNAGKSTLMNLISKSNVYAEDKLFATVDATVRKVVLDQIPFLLSDTVGFIRKLPHHLIESFKSTLNEVIECDILLHVIDISHPAYKDHISVVEKTLSEIGATNKPVIYVYNKIDVKKSQTESAESPDSSDFFNTENQCYISAFQKIGISSFKDTLLEEVKKKHYTIFPNFVPDEILDNVRS